MDTTRRSAIGALLLLTYVMGSANALTAMSDWAQGWSAFTQQSHHGFSMQCDNNIAMRGHLSTATLYAHLLDL